MPKFPLRKASAIALGTSAYSPVYDTPEKLKSTKPDLRSTIYWNPAVTTDEHGEAHISFYTADSSSRYRLAVEGVSAIGAIICSEQDLF